LASVRLSQRRFDSFFSAAMPDLSHTIRNECWFMGLPPAGWCVSQRDPGFLGFLLIVDAILERSFADESPQSAFTSFRKGIDSAYASRLKAERDRVEQLKVDEARRQKALKEREAKRQKEMSDSWALQAKIERRRLANNRAYPYWACDYCGGILMSPVQKCCCGKN
jgi:hypothetical protein